MANMKIPFRVMLLQAIFTSVFIFITALAIDNIYFEGVPSSLNTDDIGTCLSVGYIESGLNFTQNYPHNYYTNTTHFVVEGIEKEITSNHPQKFKVIAKNAAGETDTNYEGTIRFGSILSPSFYTFVKSDEGEHTFHLPYGLPVGTHLIWMFDIMIPSIRGQMPIRVKEVPHYKEHQ